jgi:hypothetical protein
MTEKPASQKYTTLAIGRDDFEIHPAVVEIRFKPPDGYVIVLDASKWTQPFRQS